MRVGQKNKLTYRWARKGSRPRAAHDQRTQSTLLGAVCPEHGTGAALVLPFCNTEAVQLHPDEIATKVTAGAHAILILDQAGWHGAKELKVPSNITLLPLPPRSPELNSQENIWQFMRQNWLSNRVFNPSATSSITAAMPGTPSSISPGKSCSSHVATGLPSVTHSEEWYNSSNSLCAAPRVLTQANHPLIRAGAPLTFRWRKKLTVSQTECRPAGEEEWQNLSQSGLKASY